MLSPNAMNSRDTGNDCRLLNNWRLLGIPSNEDITSLQSTLASGLVDIFLYIAFKSEFLMSDPKRSRIESQNWSNRKLSKDKQRKTINSLKSVF